MFSALCSFAIIPMRLRELLGVGIQCVIVVFSGHTGFIFDRNKYRKEN